MKNTNVRFLTRTGILLALTLLFQFFGRYIPLGPNSSFIVGPFVNATLIIATTFAGIWSGTAIAILAPFGAVLTGAAVPLPFVPFIATGNFIFVLFYYLLKKNRLLGLATGSLLKFGFLFASIAAFLNLSKVPSKLAAALYFTFSWPQLVTAVLGSILSLIVIKALEKTVKI